MTVENDGLPLAESAAHEPDRSGLDPSTEVAGDVVDPPTDLLPLGAVNPPVAPAPPAVSRAPASPADAAPDQATQVLPVDQRAGPPAPDPATHGSLEGDLFDGQATP